MEGVPAGRVSGAEGDDDDDGKLESGTAAHCMCFADQDPGGKWGRGVGGKAEEDSKIGKKKIDSLGRSQRTHTLNDCCGCPLNETGCRSFRSIEIQGVRELSPRLVICLANSRSKCTISALNHSPPVPVIIS